MTTLVANRAVPNGNGTSTRMRVVVPIARASDAEFDAFLCEQLREFLHRAGHARAHTLSNDELIEGVCWAFALVR